MTGAGRRQATGHAGLAGRKAGIWTPLTSFVGRANDSAELSGLLDGSQLVTVTGPGGVGKTRLALEVARGAAADRFPDGVWFIELGAVADAAQVPTQVTSALGVLQDPGRPALEVLAEVLARRRMLLILDNCEHVLSAVAELCQILLKGAEDVRILTTSRERLGLDGEAQYRLAPLGLPALDAPGAAGYPEALASEAVTLFAERARQADPRFALTPDCAPLVARVVTRLDGMPLAIELAAARVEALGMAGLADRIDDALELLTGKDPLAAARHRSLTAVADWSYQLLSEPGQRVFRRLAVIPGPFTLEAAETVAGPDAAPVVARLVDGSLLLPPRLGADGRMRYRMLQTLRAYALTRLREAGEERDATAALAAFAESVAVRTFAELETTDRELDGLRWLDAEDATLSHALGWAVEHDLQTARRLASALVPWLRLRGRIREAREWLERAVAPYPAADETWAMAQLWLGYLSEDAFDLADGMDRLTAAVDAYRTLEPSFVLAAALAGRATARLNVLDVPGARDDARRALAVAGELDDTAGKLLALTTLSLAACYAGDEAEAPGWIRQAQELLASDVRGCVARWCLYALAEVLTETGALEAARRMCGDGLARSRETDDLVTLTSLLGVMADIERQAGTLADAGALLREGIGLASRIGHSMALVTLIERCGSLCAAAGRWADAATLWAACSAELKRRGVPGGVDSAGRRAEYTRRIEQALEPDRLREAEERGARMPLSAIVEFAVTATTPAKEEPAKEEPAREEPGEPRPGRMLSPRERELVALVAQGHTNAQIAARLYISARTVASHLDRIRAKTGYRRRADLTRLALEENLV